MKKAARPVQSQPLAIWIELSEDEAKDVTRGILPERLQDECVKALEWCAMDEDGYPLAWVRFKEATK